MIERNSRRSIFENTVPIKHWPLVDESLIEERWRETFKNRCTAVTMYAEGYSAAEITKVTGVHRTALPRLALKCIEIAHDMRVMGFRGLVPYIHPNKSVRTAEARHKYPEARGGQAGLFRQTLDKYPKIEQQLIGSIRKQKSSRSVVHEKRISPKSLHSLFLKLLKAEGVGVTEWPFNCKQMGKRTIYDFFSKVLHESFDKTVMSREENEAGAHLAVGTGHKSLISFEEPFDAVQLDAYYINAFFSAEFNTPEGTTKDIQLQRLWMIAMVENNSGAVLAQNIVFRSEVSADDVVRVIRKAINPPQRLKLTIPGLEYPEGGGYPSEVNPNFSGASWGVIMLDGALAHLAKAIHERARKALGFSINWGPVGHFERRPDIERYFCSISKDIFMRMPSTTGSNPGNGRAPNGEKLAVNYKIRVEEVEQLVEVFTAQHNLTPSEGISYHSPLSFLNYYDSSEHFILRKLPKVIGRPEVLIPYTVQCIVRGSIKDGRRPYVQIDGVHYTNPVLARSSGLIGETLIVHMDDEDMRSGLAFLADGREFGLLVAMGRWSLTKHDRKTRKIILSLISQKILVVNQFCDPVQIYLDYLSNKREGNKEKTLNPQHATEVTRVSKGANRPPSISPQAELYQLTEVTLGQLKDIRPTIMSRPLPDLNKLLQQKK